MSPEAARLGRIAAELRELRRQLEDEPDAEAATALVERISALADEAAEQLERHDRDA